MMVIGGSMKVKNKYPMKITEKGKDFLKKLRNNRIKVDEDEDPLYFHEVIELIANYFKANNEVYLDMVKMEFKK